MLRRILLSFIQLHILYHAEREPVYGVALMRELRRHGYALSPGTLYPALHDLEAQGYLRCRPVVVDGRRRKYYTTTAAGRRLLSTARAKIRELSDELLGDARA